MEKLLKKVHHLDQLEKQRKIQIYFPDVRYISVDKDLLDEDKS